MAKRADNQAILLVNRHNKREEKHLWCYLLDWNNGNCREWGFKTRKEAVAEAEQVALCLLLEILKQ